MTKYILFRLLLLIPTMLAVLLVNFCLISLAPGEPTSLAPIAGQAGQSVSRGHGNAEEERYLQFRHFFGLTLPILCNTYPFTSQAELLQEIEACTKLPVTTRLGFTEGIRKQRVKLGDMAQFVMPKLLRIVSDETLSFQVRQYALQLFRRGGTQFAIISSSCTPREEEWNNTIRHNNDALDVLYRAARESEEALNKALPALQMWYVSVAEFYVFEPTPAQKLGMFFAQTRLCTYFSRVMRLDFGVLRDDPSRSVVGEAISRMKYSLTLTVVPVFITFGLSLFFGLIMAIRAGSFLDNSLSFVFLILFATPVFVVAPLLIETIALNHNFPGTSYPFPIRGFHSEGPVYAAMTAWERLGDILRHITLPLIASTYGAFAVESRLARAACLEALSYDFVITARAKGISPFRIYGLHVLRYASLPVVTALAGAFGLLLSGNIIIETIFQIRGFGNFFYEAIINRDYNVMLFGAIAGSFLALLGYLVGDIAYILLDPRLSFKARHE